MKKKLLLVLSISFAVFVWVGFSFSVTSANSEKFVFLEQTAEISETAQQSCFVWRNRRLGTRCGNPNSVELDVANNCESNVRGYVLFKKTGGGWSKSPTGLMKPGDEGNHYICSGTGETKVYYNEGADPKYPDVSAYTGE